MNTLINIEAIIPNDEDNQPLVLVFDTGDWDVTSGCDAEYVIHHVGNVMLVIPFVQLYGHLLEYFEIGDLEDVSMDCEEIELCMCEETSEAPVLLITNDSQFSVVPKQHAEMAICDPNLGVYNFIAIDEIIADFDKWFSDYQNELTEEDDEDFDDFHEED